MKLIVKPKTKKEEKVIKTFLENYSIDYLKLEEDVVVYEKDSNTKSPAKKEKLSKANIQFLNELKQSVEQVKLAKKGKIKLLKVKDLLNEL